MAGAGLFLTGCATRIHSGEGRGRPIASRPNVLIINIDDLGYGDISCHGNPAFRTPAIDALHDQCIRLTDFHAAPLCTPTRGQLITGVDALRNGARWVGTENSHLRCDLPTIAEIFRDSGYATGLFGKWHLGCNYPMRPQDRGFEEVVTFAMQEIGSAADYWGNDYFDDTYEHNGRPQKYKGFCTDVWFDLAIEWMNKSVRSRKPFICCLPTNVVHTPYFADSKYRDRPDMAGLTKEQQTFYAMLVNLDENIARMEKFLQDTRLRDNTIMIFMTDNGTVIGKKMPFNADMRGSKNTLWEGGHRVPCFIRYPAGSLAGPVDITRPTQVQDLLPTLVDLCGIKTSTDNFDGISLAPALRGDDQIPDRMFVIQAQYRLEQVDKWDACVVWGPWRLLRARNPISSDSKERKIFLKRQFEKNEITLELYNTDTDHHQDTNVMDQHPEIVSRMKQFYETWWAKTASAIDIAKPITVGNPKENPSHICASSWSDTYLIQVRDVLNGRQANGTWNLLIDSPGAYEFALSRWHLDAETPISAATEIKYTDEYTYGPIRKGKALPIKSARIKIAQYNQTSEVSSTDRSVKFKLKLCKGPAKLKTFFYDKDGAELCGAYYVRIAKKDI